MSVKVDDSVMTMEITVHELDRYNFNKNMFDIATKAPGDENGRFESAGWAKSFTTRGTVVRTVTIDLDKVDMSTINVNADCVTIDGESRENLGEGKNR